MGPDRARLSRCLAVPQPRSTAHTCPLAWMVSIAKQSWVTSLTSSGVKMVSCQGEPVNTNTQAEFSGFQPCERRRHYIPELCINCLICIDLQKRKKKKMQSFSSSVNRNPQPPLRWATVFHFIGKKKYSPGFPGLHLFGQWQWIVSIKPGRLILLWCLTEAANEQIAAV